MALNNAALELTTSFQDVYTPPSGVSVASIFSIICCNRASTSTDLTLVLTDNANTILARISFTVPVPVGAAFVPISSPVVIRPGQKLRATASANNALDIVISLTEFAA